MDENINKLSRKKNYKQQRQIKDIQIKDIMYKNINGQTLDIQMNNRQMGSKHKKKHRLTKRLDRYVER